MGDKKNWRCVFLREAPNNGANMGCSIHPLCKISTPPPNNGSANFSCKCSNIKEETSEILACSLEDAPKSKRERARSAHVRLKMLQDQEGNGHIFSSFSFKTCNIREWNWPCVKICINPLFAGFAPGVFWLSHQSAKAGIESLERIEPKKQVLN